MKTPESSGNAPEIRGIREGSKYIDKFRSFLKERNEGGDEMFEVDIDKDPWLQNIIQRAQALVRAKLEEYGIKDMPELDSRDIHFVGDKKFIAEFSPKIVDGDYRPVENIIRVRLFDSLRRRLLRPYADEYDKFLDSLGISDKKPRRISHLRKLSELVFRGLLQHVVAHEMLHRLSLRRFDLAEVKEDGGENDYHYFTRSGYSYDAKNFDFVEFESFNEAVTEKIAQDAMKAFRYYLEDAEFGSHEPLRSVYGNMKNHIESYYKKDIELLNSIIEAMSRINGSLPEQIWGDMVRGYISGDMMHLRKIDKAFGPESLRLVAYLKPFHLKNAELWDKLMKYFSADTTTPERPLLLDKIYALADGMPVEDSSDIS